MMKWKVVKNPRSSSADRSLECLKNDVQQNNANHNDSNNNVGEAPKDTNRQRESSLVRKPSVVATECINLKSILGLTRQRSETNLSSIGLIGAESRRSRSEVRGVSCDRLTVGYHTAPGNPIANGKTRSSSPASRPGWLRGRKRERESRNPVKNDPGKTVVTGSHRRRTSSDCRTIVDGSQKNRPGPQEKSSFEPRKCSRDEDIIEEEIYTEINQAKLTEEIKDPNRVLRKKGLAPKPQVATSLFKETSDVNIYSGSSSSLNGAPPSRKPPRKNQTFSGRNQDRRSDSRKMNNLKNSEIALVKINNNINAQSVVAEIHNLDNENNKRESPDNLDEELLPFHIDTPDYSTLDSVHCNSCSLSAEDILNCNTDCEESLQDSQMSSDNARVSLSSILRSRTESEPKKTVRFERLDLIEKYKRNKTESSMDTEEDTESRSPLDVDSNEGEDIPQCPDEQSGEEPNGMTVNLVVRSLSPDSQSEESPAPFVAKKSFVLTVAKQERGFRSLCANKKPEPPSPKTDQQISVTFLCSGPPSEPWAPTDRLRSTSVPPPPLTNLQPPDEVALQVIRGRSRERKSKERQHCKKNHKARKKDAVFVMPQAVIDELSQVLEKRKPSLDEIPVHP